jgi:plasmid stabilization system protein ParE
LSERALRDLDGIYDHIADAAGDVTARTFIAKLSDHLERIARTGHSGVPRDTVRPGLRLAVHGRYNIYFRVGDTETVIVRVVHSARDTRRLAFDDDAPGG